MGPYATLMFFENILRLSNAKKDWEHVHLVIDNNTKIPSRTRCIMFNEESPLSAMYESCKKLEKYPVDLIVVPCNSAEYWIPNLQENIEIPIRSTVYAAISSIQRIDCKKVSVLGGFVTYEKELYKKGLSKLGIEYIKISKRYQNKVIDLIEKIKLFNINDLKNLEKDYIKLVERLIKDYDIDGLILGCTEYSYFKEIKFSIPVIDSSIELANFVNDSNEIG